MSHYCDATFRHTEDTLPAKYMIVVIEKFGGNANEPPFYLCEACKNEMVKESIETRMYTTAIVSLT